MCNGTSNSYLHSCIQHSAAVLVIGTYMRACLCSVFNSCDWLFIVHACSCGLFMCAGNGHCFALPCNFCPWEGREERHRRCVVLPTTVVCMVMHVMPRG